MIDKELLEILRCPETKSPLHVLPEDQLAKLNEQIAAGKVKTAGSRKVESKIEEALITEDGQRIYRIEDQIPIMLIEEAIPTAGLEGIGPPRSQSESPAGG